jgi:phosphohistidine phosphatase
VQVFLIRHAPAVAETIELRDPNRHLTADGRAQACALGERLRWYDCTPTHIWSSPLVRAVQTAELVAAGMHCTRSIEIMPALAPEGGAREVVAALQALKAATPDAAVMLVGHEPSLSGIGALLANDPSFPSLAKTQAARIVDGLVRWRFAWDAEAPEPAR